MVLAAIAVTSVMAATTRTHVPTLAQNLVAVITGGFIINVVATKSAQILTAPIALFRGERLKSYRFVVHAVESRRGIMSV